MSPGTPSWVDISAPDVDAAEKVKDYGGSVYVGPMDVTDAGRMAGLRLLGGQVTFGPLGTPIGPMAGLTDAAGAPFTVVSLAPSGDERQRDLVPRQQTFAPSWRLQTCAWRCPRSPA